VIVSGGGKRGYVKYGCPAHRYRGSCGNGLYIRQDRVEDQLLSALEARLFQPAILDRITIQVRDGVRQRLREIQQADAAGSLDALRHEERSLKAQAARLADAIARSGEMDSLLGRLKNVEQDLQQVRRRMAAGRPKDLQVTDDQVRQHVTKNLMSLRSLLTGEDVLAARSAMQKHIEQLVLTPVTRDGRMIYRVSGEVDLAGSDGCVMQVVARDGLEPPTPAFSGPLDDLVKFLEINVIR
jgi:site-specific DNA recombinase